MPINTERRRHPLLRVSAALVGTAFAVVMLLILFEMFDTFSLAFPLFFLVGCFLLPVIACTIAASIPSDRYGRVLGAGVLAGLVPGLAGLWFELHTLGNSFTIDTLRWPIIGVGCGLVIGLYFARQRRDRAP